MREAFGLVTGLWTMLIVRVLFGMATKDRSALPEIKSSITGFPEGLPRRRIFSAGFALGGAVSGYGGPAGIAGGAVWHYFLIWRHGYCSEVRFIVSDKPAMRVNARRRKGALILKIMRNVTLSDDGGLRALHSAIT